jgi:hypothetical protein
LNSHAALLGIRLEIKLAATATNPFFGCCGQSKKESAMFHLTTIQFLNCAIALLMVIAVAAVVFGATHKREKVAFYKFSDAEYDRELLENGKSSETAEWLVSYHAHNESFRRQHSGANEQGTESRGVNRWDGDLN